MARWIPMALAVVLIIACREPTNTNSLGDTFQPVPSAGPAPNALTLGVESKLTSGHVSPNSTLAISGSWVAWGDNRNDGNGTLPPAVFDIYALDLNSGVERRITPSPAFHRNPSLSGTRLVWESGLIHTIDLAAGGSTVIDTTVAPFNENPMIDGTRIVWDDERSGNSEIYLFDIATGVETQLTNTASHEAIPVISGDRVVYERGLHLQLLDVVTGSEVPLSPAGSGAQRNAAISGDRVVWLDFRNGPQIWLADLATGTQTAIADGGQSPDISGDLIVWLQLVPGSNPSIYRIYLYDIATGVTTLITEQLLARHPTISGNRIIWMDRRTLDPAGYDLWMFELSSVVVSAIVPLADMVEGFLIDGSIANAGLAEPLRAFTTQASSHVVAGRNQAAIQSLNAMIRLVEGQAGSGIDPSAATALVSAAQAAIGAIAG